jgi:hypothetical protein
MRDAGDGGGPADQLGGAHAAADDHAWLFRGHRGDHRLHHRAATGDHQEFLISVAWLVVGQARRQHSAVRG